MNFRGWQYKEATLDMLEQNYPYELATVKLVQASNPITMQGSFCLDNITRRAATDAINEVAVGESGIKAWPVPATDVVNVSSADAIESIELLNMAGEILEKKTGVSSIDVSGRPYGFYLLRVTTASTTETFRIAVR